MFYCSNWFKILLRTWRLLFKPSFSYYAKQPGVTSGAGTDYPSRASEFNSPLIFSGIRVARSLFFYLMFCRLLQSLCPSSFGHCVVCSSSNYGYRLPFWYLPSFHRENRWRSIKNGQSRETCNIGHTINRTKTNTNKAKQIKHTEYNTQTMSDRGPPKNREWIQVLVKDKQFLLLIRHPLSYYTCIVKSGKSLEEWKTS